MTEAFIDRVKQIILHNIEKENFGVSDLAKELGYSRSQLLRKVKTHTGISVNKLISQIRLEESLKLLQQEDLTSSEISYKVGFSSPSYFNKCFLEYYGKTPGEYRKNSISNHRLESETHQLPTNRWYKNKLILFLLVIIAIAGMATVIYFKTTQSNTNSSLAVLPFLDLSKNNENEYLVDGLTEAITLELSKNKSMRVISRGSAMSYKGHTKLYSKIAKELDVDLLLEGSILFVNDSLKITVQLIEPFPKEKHLWQNSYQHYRSGIIELINKASAEIAHEISQAVVPESKIKRYQPKYEAYDLYLKGKHLLNSQKTNEFKLQLALGYINKSIEIDSLYAPSYVTLGEIYLAINRLIGDNETILQNWEQAKNAVDKALHLNPSLAEAYILKGSISGKHEWNWEEMKKSALKGLKLDPNNATARTLLSDYYLIKGDYKKAIDEALMAEKLDPINPYLGCFTAERYYINREFQKSINKYQQVLELYPNYGYAYNGIGYAYFQTQQENKAVDAWRTLQSIMGNKALKDCYDNNEYFTCLQFYLNQVKKDTPRFCRNPVVVSTIYMITHQDAEALKYLQIAYRYKSDDLPVMLTYPDFDRLYQDVEFRQMTKKIGIKSNR